MKPMQTFPPFPAAAAQSNARSHVRVRHVRVLPASGPPPLEESRDDWRNEGMRSTMVSMQLVIWLVVYLPI